MTTKLILTMDKSVIESAKKYVRQKNAVCRIRWKIT